jgi:DnaD/phage-associated family protein
MTFQIEPNITPISNIFVDEYMPKAPAAYVVLFLYALRYSIGGSAKCSIESIAQDLDMLESDVKKAWKYWEEQGILKLHEDGRLEFLPILSRKQEKKMEIPVVTSRRPEYSPQEMEKYLENDIVKGLFLSAQGHLGKLLSQHDMSVIFGFYDWLRLPVEVIEILLAYCVQNEHRNLNYIEKVALNWAEEGINTVPKALEYIKERRDGYREIFRAFGITGRMPTPSEEGFIKKWRKEYCLPIEIICLACEKTVLQTGKVSFAYADKILQTWKEQKVKTTADVEKLEQSFAAAKKAKKDASVQKTAAQPAKAVKQNRFVNYEQRTWDFQELERLEMEKRKNGT